MIELAIMIEGQDGLNWQRWQRLAATVERLGFAGLYRSDHFTNTSPPEKDSLDMWVSLTWLASHTQRIEFGPLVSPVSFRDPVITARNALQVDDLSGGRLRLGVGAGWNAYEHEKFGYKLLDVKPRFNRFREGLEVISRLMRSDQPVSFQGVYYNLRDAILLPRPQRPGGPPIVIGGNGQKLTLPLVAKYADEWNAVLIPPERFKELNAHLDELVQREGRHPQSVRRTMMNNLTFGYNEAELQRKLRGRKLEDLLARGALGGSSQQVTDQLGRFAEAGVQRIMLQWLDLDDMDGLEAFAQTVMPHFK